MKLKTKLKIAFFIMAALPVILGTLAVFFITRRELSQVRNAYGADFRLSDMYSSGALLGKITDTTFAEVQKQATENADVFFDREYLAGLDSEVDQEIKGKACDVLECERFDLVLLDIMLPGADGYEVLDYIKPMEIPVIFLTAKGSTEDKVKGLKLGADDYLTKPFEIVELLARVESILRRAGKTQAEIVVDDLVIDTRSRSVRRGNKDIALTMKEFELLLLFARNKNIALFRETLYENVWGSDFMGDSRTVDLHVQRLRKKLHWEDKIKAIYKVGYRLEV